MSRPRRTRTEEIEDRQLIEAMRNRTLVTTATMPAARPEHDGHARAVVLISQRHAPTGPELAEWLRATADAIETATNRDGE